MGKRRGRELQRSGPTVFPQIPVIGETSAWDIIGDVRRFERPEKLVAYIGLNPGQRESGRGKNIKLGVGKRGRGDMRNLLVQGAHAVLRMGKTTPLGQWGWKLFARKGQRNIAVVAVARKLLVQVSLLDKVESNAFS